MTALISPHSFREQILLFGGGGGGKSENLSHIARAMPFGTFRVWDNDISPAWQRIVAAEDLPNVEISESDDGTWDEGIEIVTKMTTDGDPDTDWLAIDSITPTWEWVQSWWTEKAYGEDIVSFLAALKIEHAGDLKAYSKALQELMNWPVIKKEYAKLYRLINKWKGHVIVTAGAKDLSKDNEKPEIRMTYGHLGVKPAGEGELYRIASTNILCSHTSRNTWKLNTAKDRKRERMQNLPVEDFAIDYLMDVAEWTPMRTKKKGT